MSNVLQLKPCANAAIALRNIADSMESGEYASDEVTVIAGTDIFHCGCFDDCRAVEGAVFNMTLGLQVLMKPVLDDME